MRDKISAAVGPLDFLDEISVNDIAKSRLGDAAAPPNRGEFCSTRTTEASYLTKELVLRIETVERVDRMVAGAEARRHDALREIDRHRATLAAALRQAAVGMPNSGKSLPV